MPLDGARADKNPARAGDKSSEESSDRSSQSRFLNEAAQLRGNIVIPSTGTSANERSMQILEARLQTLLKNHHKPKAEDEAKPKAKAEHGAKLDAKGSAENGWIERLDSKKPNITELKIHYPVKKEEKSNGKAQSSEKSKGVSIKLGLDPQGNLVTIGDELKKGKDGVWREKKEDGTWTAASRQNYSFDLDSGRYTLADKSRGKWFGVNGEKGKVEVKSNGDMLYHDKDGQLEYKKRLDGSKIYYDEEGHHAYTRRPDGSEFHVKERTIISSLNTGETRINNVDDGSIINKDRNKTITSVAKGLHRLEYERDEKGELSKVSMIAQGARKGNPVWQKGKVDAGIAKVHEDGTLHITRADESKTVYNYRLQKSDYRPGEAEPFQTVQADGRVAGGGRNFSVKDSRQAAVAKELASARTEYNKTFRETILPELLSDPARRVNGRPISHIPVDELAKRHALAQAAGKDLHSFDERQYSKLSKVPAAVLASAYNIAQSKAIEKRAPIAKIQKANAETEQLAEESEIGPLPLPNL